MEVAIPVGIVNQSPSSASISQSRVASNNPFLVSDEVIVVLVLEVVFVAVLFYLSCCSQGFEHLVQPPRCTSLERDSQPVRMCLSLAGAEQKGYEEASYWLRFLGEERTSYVALNRKLIQLASSFRSFQMTFDL